MAKQLLDVNQTVNVNSVVQTAVWYCAWGRETTHSDRVSVSAQPLLGDVDEPILRPLYHSGVQRSTPARRNRDSNITR